MDNQVFHFKTSENIRCSNVLERCLTERNFFADFIANITPEFSRKSYDDSYLRELIKFINNIGISSNSYGDIIKQTYYMIGIRTIEILLKYTDDLPAFVYRLDRQKEKIIYEMIGQNKKLNEEFYLMELRNLFWNRKLEKFYPQFLNFIDYRGLIKQSPIDFDMFIEFLKLYDGSYRCKQGMIFAKMYIDEFYKDKALEFDVLVDMMLN